MQQRHVRAVLRSYRLFRAAIPGLGLRFRLTLCLRGVWTAEQVCAGKAAVLERYDRGRIVPIVAWAAAARRSARSSMPRSLPPPMRDAVAAPYRRHRQRMMDARGRALDEERRLLAAVTALFGDRHAALDVAAEVVSSAFQAQRRDIQARRSKLQGEEAELRQRLCRAEQVFRLFPLITLWRYVRKAVSYEPRAMSDHP
ncbi:MAG: hypothetical protein JOZ41_09670 [Chloroflexi bacterium]|nr:hypothetical protein [Chloroflexota bacterium]